MDFTLGAGWLWPSLPDLVLNKNELICGKTPPCGIVTPLRS
jgi:hypothetical protein